MDAEDFAVRLRQRREYTELVNAINRELVDRHPVMIGRVAGHAYRIGGAVGGSAGGAAAAIGIALLLGGPFTWGIAAAGAVVGGVVGWLFSNAYVNQHQAQAIALHNEVEGIVNRVLQIHETYAQNRADRLPEEQVRPVAAIQALRSDLATLGYITPVAEDDHINFNFNEQRFTTVSSWYEADSRTKLVDNLKFVILFALAALPTAHRPSDRLITELSTLTNRIEDRSFKNSGRFAMGLLYTDRGDIQRAREWFRAVDNTSLISATAQRAIGLLAQG